MDSLLHDEPIVVKSTLLLNRQTAPWSSYALRSTSTFDQHLLVDWQVPSINICLWIVPRLTVAPQSSLAQHLPQIDAYFAISICCSGIDSYLQLLTPRVSITSRSTPTPRSTPSSRSTPTPRSTLSSRSAPTPRATLSSRSTPTPRSTQHLDWHYLRHYRLRLDRRNV